MEEKKIQNNEEIEIDLQRLFTVLLSKAWLMGLVAVVCAVVVLLGTVFLVAPTYQSSAMFYVNNSDVSLGEASLSISTGDISASRGLVKSYIVILKTRESINAVIDYAGIKRSYGEVRSMITAAAVDDTEIFRVTVTSEDPYEAERIANAIAYILPKRISSIIEGTSAKIVDSAVVASNPSAPNYTRNAMLGFALGLSGAADWLNEVGVGGIITKTTSFLAQPVSAAMLFSIGFNFSMDGENRKEIFKISGICLAFAAAACLVMQGVLFLVPGVDALTRWVVLLYCLLPASYLAPGLSRNEGERVMASGVCSVITVITLVGFCAIAAFV